MKGWPTSVGGEQAAVGASLDGGGTRRSEVWMLQSREGLTFPSPGIFVSARAREAPPDISPTLSKSGSLYDPSVF